MRFRKIALLAAAPFCAALLLGLAAARTPAETVGAGIFDVDDLKHVVDEPEPAALFDRNLRPSRYETLYVEFRESRHLKVVRPYDGASFPRNFGPPNIRWEDRSDNVWRISIKAPDWTEPLVVVTDKKEWRPDAATWGEIKKAAEGRSVELEIRGTKVENGERMGEVYVDAIEFRVSEYEADPVVVYRLVSPLFHAFKTPDIFSQNVSGYERKVMFPSAGIYCSNCHSFPLSPDIAAEDFGMSIAIRPRLGKGGDSLLGLYNFHEKTGTGIPAITFFMSWHPDGDYLAVCAGVSTYQNPLVTLETQEFLMLEANIHIMSRDGAQDKPLPGASTKKYMETFPAWSADTKTILFTRAPEMSEGGSSTVRFDVYQVPYNDGKGGEATPFPGAAHNGASNFFPRFSPDGRWMVWTKADWASLVMPSADLWIASTAGSSAPRRLECSHAYSMDSHHSWSSNSRWLIFSSKRDDGIFTRLYVSEIDENGHALPPVELPSDDDNLMLCYNVPEFMKYAFQVDPGDMLGDTTGFGRDR